MRKEQAVREMIQENFERDKERLIKMRED